MIFVAHEVFVATSVPIDPRQLRSLFKEKRQMDPVSSKAIDDKRPTLESQSVDFCDTREWRAEREKGQDSQINKTE